MKKELNEGTKTEVPAEGVLRVLQKVSSIGMAAANLLAPKIPEASKVRSEIRGNVELSKQFTERLCFVRNSKARVSSSALCAIRVGGSVWDPVSTFDRIRSNT